MSHNNWIEKVRNLLMEAEIADALATFFQYNQNRSTEDTLIILTSRWNGLSKEEEMGTVDPRDAKLEKNKIRAAIQSLLKKAERNSAPTEIEVNDLVSVENGKLVVKKLEGGTVNIFTGPNYHNNVQGDNPIIVQGNTSGGDFNIGNKTVQGDEVDGDKVGRDKFGGDKNVK